MQSNDLRKAGLKATLPRLKILEVLQHNRADHLSAEGVYRRLIDSNEDIGLATIYRVLSQFEDAGLVIRHHFEDGHALFELDQGPHDHLICMKCGHIEEFFDDEIQERQKSLAEKSGFDLSKHTLVLYGDCQTANCENNMPDHTTGKTTNK